MQNPDTISNYLARAWMQNKIDDSTFFMCFYPEETATIQQKKWRILRTGNGFDKNGHRRRSF